MKRILIAEDNTANRELLREALCIRGHEVFEALDGREAVARALECRPDLVLLDIQMPLMDGYAALSQLREQPELAGVHIIALTAFAMSDDKLRIMQAGFDGYI